MRGTDESVCDPRVAPGWAAGPALAGAVMAYLQRATARRPGRHPRGELFAGASGGCRGTAVGVRAGLRQRWRWRGPSGGSHRSTGGYGARRAARADGAQAHLAARGSGVPLYGYEILVDRGSGKRRTIATCYEGSALAPSAVVSRDRDVPPPGGAGPRRVEGEAWTRDAPSPGDHTSGGRVPPEERGGARAGGALERRRRVYRSDVSYVEPGETVDLAACRLVERHVRPGAPVCVFGPFSESPRRHRPAPQLVQADPARGRGRGPGGVDLGASAVRRLGIGLLAGAAAAGLVAAFPQPLKLWSQPEVVEAEPPRWSRARASFDPLEVDADDPVLRPPRRGGRTRAGPRSAGRPP